MAGRVVAVCRSPERGKPKEDGGTGFFEAGLGLAGDAHAGTEKEVSLLAKEKVDQLSRETGISFPPAPSPRTCLPLTYPWTPCGNRCFRPGGCYPAIWIF